MKELRAYQQSEAYKMCAEKIQEKIKKEDSSSGLMNTLLNGHKGGDCDGFSTFDVPIFTEEFLDQNKAREAELRRLRKMSVAFQEQNAVLQKHTQSMSSARERLEQELALEERRTLALQQQLQAVRQALTANFASLPVPGTGETPTLSTLDFYMARLHGSMESDPALAREAHRPHQGDPGPGRQVCTRAGLPPAHSAQLGLPRVGTTSGLTCLGEAWLHKPVLGLQRAFWGLGPLPPSGI